MDGSREGNCFVVVDKIWMSVRREMQMEAPMMFVVSASVILATRLVHDVCMRLSMH